MQGDVVQLKMVTSDVFDIKLDDLVPFHLHPVQTKQGDQLEELVNSIKVSGQTTPITVRSVADGKYEIICGHNRVEVMRMLGYDTIHANVVNDMSDDAAMELFYNTYLTPRSFWSWDYLQRFRAVQYMVKVMKKNSHQGKRNDLIEKISNTPRDEQEHPSRRPTIRDRAASSIGISPATLSRYRSMVKLPDKSLERMAHLLDEKLLTFDEAYQVSKVDHRQAAILLDLVKAHPDKRLDSVQLKELGTKEKRMAASLEIGFLPRDLEYVLVPRKL